MSRSPFPRLLAAIVAGLLLTVLVVRGSGTTRSAAANAMGLESAHQAAKAMLAWYYRPDEGLLTSYAPSDRAPYALLWGYSWGLQAIESVAALPGGTRYLPLVRRLADDLDRYWDGKARVPAYAPTIDPGAYAIKFYDDNAWAGLDLLQAFELTADARYLREAEVVFSYLKTGWDARRGGIYWNDARDTRNTAATAPTAELAAGLYLATGRQDYLAWAKKIFTWEVRYLVDQRSGQVWGNVDADGNVSATDWTYNQGTVIGAAVLLYRITQDRSYLLQARKTEGFVLRNLVRPDGTIVPPAEFGGVLADNLRLLYEETGDPVIARVVAASSRSALLHARNGDNLYANDWDGPPADSDGLPLLTQSGAVRLLAVRAAIGGGSSWELAFGGVRLPAAPVQRRAAGFQKTRLRRL